MGREQGKESNGKRGRGRDERNKRKGMIGRGREKGERGKWKEVALGEKEYTVK